MLVVNSFSQMPVFHQSPHLLKCVFASAFPALIKMQGTERFRSWGGLFLVRQTLN